MLFFDILKELVDSVEIAQAATVMGVDGITVRQYPLEGALCDMESVGVEYGGALEEIKKASRLLNLGELEEVAVFTLGPAVIMRMITQEYFIAMVVGSGANMGRARYHLRRAAVKAKEEL